LIILDLLNVFLDFFIHFILVILLKISSLCLFNLFICVNFSILIYIIFSILCLGLYLSSSKYLVRINILCLLLFESILVLTIFIDLSLEFLSTGFRNRAAILIFILVLSNLCRRFQILCIYTFWIVLGYLLYYSGCFLCWPVLLRIWNKLPLVLFPITLGLTWLIWNRLRILRLTLRSNLSYADELRSWATSKLLAVVYLKVCINIIVVTLYHMILLAKLLLLIWYCKCINNCCILSTFRLLNWRIMLI